MLKSVIAAGALVTGATYFALGLSQRAIAPQKPPAAAAAAAQEDRPGSVTLRADDDGHFRVDATIGGRRVPMLVDTGATVVALSYEQGETLGLVSGGDRFDLRVSTANGQVGAKRVVLRDVRVGSVQMQDVSAVVMTQGALDGNLLGMSFLGRLRRLETAQNRLTLER